MSILNFFARTAGYFLLAIAVISLVADGTYSIAQSELAARSLGQVWFAISPETLNLAQAAIQRHVSPLLWDPVIQTILVWPVWAVAGPLAVLLVWMTSPKSTGRPAYA